MSTSNLNNFYLQQQEPLKGCLLALREIVLAHNSNITTALKYSMPFFLYKGKMFCYLWVRKKDNQPYIGFVEGKHLNHASLLQEKRSRMKIMLFDATKDLPIRKINSVLKEAIALYTSGTIKIKEKNVKSV
jgi:hypothetical protein